MYCPKCGSHNNDNAKFCRNCGETFDNIPKTTSNGICPYCNEKIHPYAKKCKHCGEWIDKNHTTVKKEDHSGTIILGWIFTIFGSIPGLIILFIPYVFSFLSPSMLNFLSFVFIISGIGFIISLFLISKSDKRARNHGWVMFIINIFWLIIFFWLISNIIMSYSYYY